METIDIQEFKESVFKRLANGESRNEIIFDLCEQFKCDWNEAENFVDQVQARYKHTITLKQSPLLVILALGIFLTGAGLLVFVIYNAISLYSLLYWARSQMPNDGPFAWKVAHDFIIVMFTTGQENVGLIITGIGMIAGSLKGMQEIWTAIFAKLGWIRDAD